MRPPLIFLSMYASNSLSTHSSDLNVAIALRANI